MQKIHNCHNFQFLLINNSFAVTGNGEIKLSQNVISGYMQYQI